MKRIQETELCPSQWEKWQQVIRMRPTAVILRVSDEKTGVRFGNAVKRKGFAVKIGSGGRNKGQKGYQIWASWAKCDQNL